MAWELGGNIATNPPTDFLGTTDPQPLVFKTNRGERVRLDVSGNLGIGTTTPEARLHIYSPDDNALKVTNTVVGKSVQIGVDQLGAWLEPTEQNSSIRLNANPTRTGLLIDGQTGNVGIGTTQPGRLLTLEGGPELALRLQDNRFSAFWELQASAFLIDHFGIVRYEGGVAQASKSLIITPDGTVGIGTTTPNPNNALHVHQTGSHATGILAESDTGAGLAAVTQSPDFVALSAENRQGSAINAFGSETGQFSTGITARGLIAVSGESQNGTAISGIAHSQQSPNVSGVGVHGQCLGKPGAGVIGISQYGTGVIAFGGTQAAGGDGLYAGTDFGWCGKFVSTDGRSLGGVYVSVPAGQAGLQVASGTKSAIVPTSQGSRSLYSEEATEVWFTDYGFGQLQAGRTSVSIDPLFAETVNLNKFLSRVRAA